MDSNYSGNESDQPLTRWRPVNRSLDEMSGSEQNCSKRFYYEKSSDEAYSALIASSIKEEIQDPGERIPSSKRKRKAATETESADAKFSALVTGSVKKENKGRLQKDKSKDKRQEPWHANVNPKHLTSRCFDLAETILGVKLKSYNVTKSSGNVRSTVELGFGKDKLLYLAFESDDSMDLCDAELVEYFVNDHDYIAEIAPSLEKLCNKRMYQSFLWGIVDYADLKESRREVLQRLRVKYRPLMNVESAEGGYCIIEARDSRRTYFQAQWKVMYKNRLDAFDNAFMFCGNQNDSPIEDTSEVFNRLTNGKQMKAEDIEKSWEEIMEAVKELSEK